MSMSNVGVWAVGVWAETVWAADVWYEQGAPVGVDVASGPGLLVFVSLFTHR